MRVFRQHFLLLSNLYQIPSGQDKVRRVIDKCMTCFRTRNRTINQMMGDLPRDRVVTTKPFEKTGLLFSGPVITKHNLNRSRVTLKSYIFALVQRLFIHLEIVLNLCTEAFTLCFRSLLPKTLQTHHCLE
ncbi:hypothetical protein X975_26619, partial [Stegodyphus mimosarum]